MLPLLLIDTREPPPDPDRPGRGRDAWRAVAAALRWAFPWPAIVLWLFVGTVVLRDVPGMLFAMATIVVAAWRLSLAYPRWGGLSDHRQ